MKKPALILIVGLVVLAILGFYVLISAQKLQWMEPKKGTTVIDSYEITDPFPVRIQVFNEAPNAGSKYGCHIVIEGRPNTSSPWRQIGNGYYMRCVPFSFPDHIRVINDDIVYVFWEVAYIVTTDGGNSWKFWDAYRNMPSEVYSGNGDLIQHVNVGADGIGRMTLNPLRTVSRRAIELTTNDYGVTWNRLNP